MSLSHLGAFSMRGERFGDGVVLRPPALHLAVRLSLQGRLKTADAIEKTRLGRVGTRRREPVRSTPSKRRKQNETAR